MEKEDADMAKLDRYFNTPVRKRSSDPKLARPGPQSSHPQVDASKAGASRSSGPVSKTKILSKLPNGGRIPSENKKHSWEKPEPKKNRPANNKPSGSFNRTPPVIENRTNPLSLNKTGSSTARVNNSTNLTGNISISKTGNSSLNKTGSSIARVNNSLNKTGSSEVKQWGSQSPRPQKSRQPKKPNTSGSGPHLSESKLGEESGGVKAKDVKAKDVNKRKRGADLEKGAGSSSQKMSGGNGNVQKKKRVLILSDDEDFAVDDVPVKKQETRPIRPVSDDKPQTAATTTTKQRTARPRAGRKPPVKKCANPKGKARADTASPLIPGQVEDDKEEILAAAKAAIAPAFAPKDILWRTTEQFFRPLSGDDMAFISKEIGSHSNPTGDDILTKKGKAENISPGSVSNGDKILTSYHLKAADVDPTLDQIVKGTGARSAPAGISISQTLMSAIISPDEIAMIDQSISNGQDDSNTPADPFEEASGTFRNPNDVIKLIEDSTSGSGSAATSAVVVPYEKMSFDERILFELHELGVYPDVSDPLTNDQGDKSAGTSSKKPDLATTSGQDSIDDEIAKLQAELSQNISDKNALLIKAEQDAKSEKESQYREFSKRALDNLLLQANKKSQASKKRKGSKLSAEGFMRRTLDRVKEFEKTGMSVFDEKEYRDLFDAYVSKSSPPNDISKVEKAPAGKRKRGEGPASSSKPKKAQKREGLPPLYPKINNKQEKEKEKGKAKEKEKEKGAGLADLAGLPLPDDIPEIGDFGGVAEVDSMGLDIPMDDLSDLFF